MSFTFGLLLILCGLGIMGFGLFIFYAWLPFFYALIGLEIGFLLGKWLSGDPSSTMTIALTFIGALAAAGAANFLEPYRRILLGYWGGALLSLSLAALLGLERLASGFIGIILAIAGGVIGAIITSRIFDLFVVVASAFGGATMVVAGALMPLTIMGWSAPGIPLQALSTLVLTIVRVAWQLGHLAQWANSQSPLPDPLADQTRRVEPRKT